ncbi:MAG: DUF975 family protein [Anaerovoracaceae bacterium]
MENEFENKYEERSAAPEATEETESTPVLSAEEINTQEAPAEEAFPADAPKTQAEPEPAAEESQEASVKDSPEEISEEIPEPEIEFNGSFRLSEVRARGVQAQKHNLLRAWPKVLFACAILMLPPLLLMVLGVARFSDAPAAGRAIEVIASLVPLILGGPVMMGLTAGAMHISRGEKFRTGTLFFAFRDNWFFKAVGSFVLLALAAGLCTLVCTLPAAAVHALSEGLGEGFAFIATQVLVYLLAAAGVLFAAALYLRLAFVMPLLIDHPQMKVLNAVKLSFRGTKGCTWKLLCLLLSYLGWAVLSLGIAAVLIAGIAAAGYYLLILPMFYSGDVYSAYWYMLLGAAVLYFAGYLLIMTAVSTFLLRPLIGLTTFYDVMTGREPAPTDIKTDDVPGSETDPAKEEAADSTADTSAEDTPDTTLEDTQDTPEETSDSSEIYD